MIAIDKEARAYRDECQEALQDECAAEEAAMRAAIVPPQQTAARAVAVAVQTDSDAGAWHHDPPQDEVTPTDTSHQTMAVRSEEDLQRGWTQQIAAGNAVQVETSQYHVVVDGEEVPRRVTDHHSLTKHEDGSQTMVVSCSVHRPAQPAAAPDFRATFAQQWTLAAVEWTAAINDVCTLKCIKSSLIEEMDDREAFEMRARAHQLLIHFMPHMVIHEESW